MIISIIVNLRCITLLGYLMVLMEDEIFESISIESKVLYSYMLNRMGLSYKNGRIFTTQLKV